MASLYKKTKAPKPPRIIFRDAKGRFVPESERYRLATSVWVVRGQKRKRKYVRLLTRAKPGKIGPKDLQTSGLTITEFESLPEAIGKSYDLKTSEKKYVAWQLAMDASDMRPLRNKLIKYTMHIMDGKRLRNIVFYHQMKGYRDYSYALFKHMNEAIGALGLFLYDKVGGKLLADRKGKKVTLKGMTLEEVQ